MNTILTKRDNILFKSIGVVSTSRSDDDVRNRVAEQESTIEIFPKYKAALKGLAGFSHIFVLSYFNKLRPEQIGPLQVKPRGLLKFGYTLKELPLIGAFALDSPTRPNPIGLSLVPLLALRGNKVVVKDLDLFNETPVLDIKPYQNSYRVDSFSLPAWHTKLSDRTGHV
jgi:tRNA (adenine37-N6)-methyltransferase